VQTARNYLLRGPSYTAVKSPLAVMQILKIWGKIKKGIIRFLSQTNSILLFGPRITVQKFNQNRIKIVAVGVFTDRMTE